jgi:hypothetical protein
LLLLIVQADLVIFLSLIFLVTPTSILIKGILIHHWVAVIGLGRRRDLSNTTTEEAATFRFLDRLP